MKFIYKTVSLAQFLKDNKDARIGMANTAPNQAGLANQASMAIERLINYYAQQGWEYVRSEEFYADFFKSGLKIFFDEMGKTNNNPRLQMFIFRKVYSDSSEKSKGEEGYRELESESNISFKSKEIDIKRGFAEPQNYEYKISSQQIQEEPNEDFDLKANEEQSKRRK
jgi:hypothetical protein